MQKLSFIVFLLIVQFSFTQQIDYKNLLRNDTNLICKTTVFNWYWSTFMNKTMKFRHIREYSVYHKESGGDTIKKNTLAFDTNGRLLRWNSVLFKYSFNSSFLGYVDTIKSLAILPNVYNDKVFTDFLYYTELRDIKNNLLSKSNVVETIFSDSLEVVYKYHPDLFIKAQEKEIFGVKYYLPEGPKSYLNSIQVFRIKKLIFERFLEYEFY